MSCDKYILDGKNPVLCRDLIKWANWFETANRHVAQTYVENTRISTVFLGLDHQFNKGKPLLFETMVFGDPLDEEMNRYATWAEAKKGHGKMVQRVKAAIAEAEEAEK